MYRWSRRLTASFYTGEGGGRSAALAGRPVARRFATYSCEYRDAEIVSAELSQEPVEELALPLVRHVALEWCWQHFEDLEPTRIAELVARLNRPTGPLV